MAVMIKEALFREMLDEMEKSLRTEGMEKIIIEREDKKEISRTAYIWEKDGQGYAQIGKIVYEKMSEERNVYKLNIGGKEYDH
jgi:hypothetical protein